MNLSRLKLSESIYQRTRAHLEENAVRSEEAKIVYIQEKFFSNWRKEIQEEHPYVEVFPSMGGLKPEGAQQPKTPPKSKKKLKTNLL